LRNRRENQGEDDDSEVKGGNFKSHNAFPRLARCRYAAIRLRNYIGRFLLAKTIIDLKHADLTLGNAAASVHVLKGIDLEISAGESVGIVGPSGSGKSTLLMVLAGLEKLDSGEININDTPLHALSEDQVADFRGRNIGIVFQSFHLIANMTALENVAVPLELANVPNPFEIARRELASVGLAERLNHYPGQLSGGEQQRVAIARALAPSPALLIADEPTGNLDTDTGRQIADLLFSKQAERGMTLLLVTHDIGLANRCSRQIRVRSGRIEGDSAVRQSEAAIA
jgi:putative ABC transport system ATP-binding protein